MLWATGFQPDYSWLKVPAFDRKGALRHDGGVAVAPGVYMLGLPLMRTRKSSFIFGADEDCGYVASHVKGCLGDVRSPVARAQVR